MLGKETWKDLATLCEKIARVEADYHKALVLLVKNTPLGKEEIGTSKNAFRQIQNELTAAAGVYNMLIISQQRFIMIYR